MGAVLVVGGMIALCFILMYSNTPRTLSSQDVNTLEALERDLTWTTQEYLAGDIGDAEYKRRREEISGEMSAITAPYL